MSYILLDALLIQCLALYPLVCLLYYFLSIGPLYAVEQ